MRTASSGGPVVLIPILALAACGGGGDHPDGATATVDAPAAIDAPPAIDATPSIDADDVLGCLGDPPPAITGPVTITGRVFVIEAYTPTEFAGATVELRRIAGDAVLDTAISDTDGAFTITATAPLDAYLRVTAADHLPTYAYADADAQWIAQDALVFVADAAELATWYADAGTTYAPGARTVLAVMRDCAIDPASDATLAVAPSQPVVYYDDAAMHWDPALTAATNGFALVPSAPSTLDLIPAFAGATFPPETVSTIPDAITLAAVTPYD